MTWAYTTDRGDRRLLMVDLEGSRTHVEMLARVGLLTKEEAKRLGDGLARIRKEASQGRFDFSDTDEDVHSAVERRLTELVGEVAGKLHTARSRNDQVALDLRLYLREQGAARTSQLQDLAGLLADIAEHHAETVVASYTHLQQAQPTTLGHTILAFAWPALRTASRFEEAVARIAHSPLGAGASSGSSLPVDPGAVAATLGMRGVMSNSLDAVGSRDFVSEYVFCCAQAMVDLSRLAESLILWASAEFGWIAMSDEVSTGSSALPHKRNPDIPELVRGRAATVIGHLAAILALQKALPLAYNRDLQEDKRIVFGADDILAGSLDAIVEFLSGVSFNPPPPRGDTAALDLAERLVSRGVSFREAHEVVGRLVARLGEDGKTLADAKLAELANAHQAFEQSDLQALDPALSVRARTVPGSGSPRSVRDQVAAIRRLIA